MRVYIIGTGMDQAGTLTVRGLELIKGAGMLIGAGRMLRSFVSADKETLISYDFSEIAAVLKEKAKTSPEGFYAAVLVSGDCSFYSGARSLLRLLKDESSIQAELVPGISSIAYFCAAAGTAMEDMETVSLHGRNSSIAIRVKTAKRTFFLLGGKVTASDICRQLSDYGMPHVRITVGENLGLENERILRGSAIELCGICTDNLTVLLAENDSALRFIPSGIADGEFIRGSVPMTKADIRALIAASLDICSCDTCWDVGCGTGSVSVEMAYRCKNGCVYAFDKSGEALKLTEANSKKFGCDNITTVKSDFPEQGLSYKRPDCVFIGGSGGRLEDIMRLSFLLNPAVRIAVTAVTLDTLFKARSLFYELSGGCRIRQVSVSYIERKGSADMLKARNPVFIIDNRI